MEKKIIVPKLRFPEFDEEWGENVLGNISKFSKGKGISKSEISDDGLTDCIRYGELYTSYEEVIDEVFSRTNSKIENLVLSEANDVIIPASGETQIDIATASCVVRSGIALGGDLNIIKSKCNGIFLSYYLNNKKKTEIANLAQGISVVHLYSSQLSLLELKIPSISEQAKIASFISAIAIRISKLNKKKGLLEQYKNGVMQKLFSQEMRFKDENGNDFPDWEETKMENITFKVGKKNKQNIKYPIYSINNIEGFKPQSEQFDGYDSNTRGYDISMYKIIERNTFAYNPARINVGSIGYSGDLHEIIISSLYVCFKTTAVVNDMFLMQFLRTPQFNNAVLTNVEGGVREYLFSVVSG